MWKNILRSRTVISILVICVWLIIWQLASTLTGAEFILASPVKVFLYLKNMMLDAATYRIIMTSCARIMLGFTWSFITAFIIGTVASEYRTVQLFMAPPVAVMKSLPVAAFIIMVLMYTGSSYVSAVISYIVVFPVIYYSVLDGLGSSDVKLEEMAKVYGMSAVRRFRYIRLPACEPSLKAGLKSAVGMCWKAGVAAEVIGISAYSVGEQMYLSKLYMEGAALLAWGIVVVAAGFVSEKLITYIIFSILHALSHMRLYTHMSENISKKHASPYAIKVWHITKAYEDKMVIDDISLEAECGKVLCLMGASGEGKTTLLRIIMGLEKPDYGELDVPDNISAVFQENRLCSHMSAVENVCMTLKTSKYSVIDVRNELEALLGNGTADRPAGTLSGGMQRRCEIVRAMLADSQAVIMDEPFAGLDDDNKEIAARYIADRLKGRPLMIATHDTEDLWRFGADVIVIDKDRHS